jgi:hypothetical protein
VIDFFDLEKSFAGVPNVLDHKLLNEVKGHRESDRREHRCLDMGSIEI